MCCITYYIPFWRLESSSSISLENTHAADNSINGLNETIIMRLLCRKASIDEPHELSCSGAGWMARFSFYVCCAGRTHRAEHILYINMRVSCVEYASKELGRAAYPTAYRPTHGHVLPFYVYFLGVFGRCLRVCAPVFAVCIVCVRAACWTTCLRTRAKLV